MAGIEEHAKQLNIKAAMSTLIISAFGFVAALFWRDAIRDLLDIIIPHGEGLSNSLTAAVLVSVIAIIVIYILSKTEAFSFRETIKVVIQKKQPQKGKKRK